MTTRQNRNGEEALSHHKADVLGAPSHALLHIDGMKLLLKQSDIRGLGGVSEIDRCEPPPTGAGWINFQHVCRPVYSLSKELAMLSAWPQSRRVCVLLLHGSDFFGVLADEMEILAQQPITSSPLPDCMKLPGTPIESITTFRDGIACITSASSLFAYLRVAMAGNAPQPMLISREHEHAWA
jgi:hypothetical protein